MKIETIKVKIPRIKPRLPVLPSKPQRDRTKYRRKDKHAPRHP